MSKQEVSVLVTDLDDTLYSWFSVWYESFSALLDGLVQDSGIPKERLVRDIRAVHQRHGTSEYAFLVEEIPSLMELHPGENLGKVYAHAIQASREARDKALVLFEGVRATLQAVKGRGACVIAYTETMGMYTHYRMKRLGLDGLIDIVYLPKDHELPKNLTPEQLQTYTHQYEPLSFTRHRHTPDGEHKPSPRVLLGILDDIGATPDRAIYVGDKPFKDIAMAEQAGITSVMAAYGDALNFDSYRLLQDVSHWTDADIEREMVERSVVTEQGLGKANFDLRHGFAEILDHFDFVPHLTREGC